MSTNNAPPEDVEAVGLQLRACEQHRDDLKRQLDEAEPRLVRALEEVESLKKALRISEQARDDWRAAVADLCATYQGKDAGRHLPGAMADARQLLGGEGQGLRSQIADLQAALDVAKIDFDALKAQSRDLRGQLRAALAARDTWKREAERLESFHEQRAEDADG